MRTTAAIAAATWLLVSPLAHAKGSPRTFVDTLVGITITCPAGVEPSVNRVSADDLKNLPSYAFAVLSAKGYKVDYVYVRKPKGQPLLAFTQMYLANGGGQVLSREATTVGSRPAVLVRLRHPDGPDGPFHAVEAIALSKPDLALVQVAYMPDRSVIAKDATYKAAVSLMRTSVRFSQAAE